MSFTEGLENSNQSSFSRLEKEGEEAIGHSIYPKDQRKTKTDK